MIWLLQYRINLNSDDLNSRKILLNYLKENNVRYIDTYKVLHNNPKSLYKPNQIWIGHHTTLGNSIVCQEVKNSGLFK